MIATIEQRPGGQWTVVIDVPRPDGTVHKVAVGRYAAKFRAQQRADQINGGPPED